MQLWLQDLDCPLSYMSEIRSYTMSAPESMVKKNEVWPCYTVNFCPYCGTQLPNDLVEERMNILEKEYGIDHPYDPKQKKLIPKEFFTDEWWKKRGL
jgi:uncharacterized protein DUF6980